MLYMFSSHFQRVVYFIVFHSLFLHLIYYQPFVNVEMFLYSKINLALSGIFPVEEFHTPTAA